MVSLKSPPPASASSSGPSGAGKTSSRSLVRNPFFDDDDEDDDGGSLARLQQRQHPLSAPALGLGSGSSLSPPSSRSASPVSTLGHRKDRATRRSADVLLHMRAIDDGERQKAHGVRVLACCGAIAMGSRFRPITFIHSIKHTHFPPSATTQTHNQILTENRARLQQQSSSGIRETNKADIATDEIGALMGVNEYCVVKELGRGAFAEVKLCRKQVGSPAASPFSSPCPSPAPMPVSEGEEEGGSPISSGAGRGSVSGGQQRIGKDEELYVRLQFPI